MSSPPSMPFLARSLILARLQLSVSFNKQGICHLYLFWNQIWTERSVMLISSAILSLTVAVGVGFLLNSTSSVASWSWVARCLFWFFCCWVRVLLRGGLLDALVPVVLDCAEGVGDGVAIFLKSASSEWTDIMYIAPDLMLKRHDYGLCNTSSFVADYCLEILVAIGETVEARSLIWLEESNLMDIATI